jgi:glutamine cyclotransferase
MNDRDEDLYLSSSPSVGWPYESEREPPRLWHLKRRTIFLVSCSIVLVATSTFLAIFVSARNNSGAATTTGSETSSSTPSDTSSYSAVNSTGNNPTGSSFSTSSPASDLRQSPTLGGEDDDNSGDSPTSSPSMGPTISSSPTFSILLDDVLFDEDDNLTDSTVEPSFPPTASESSSPTALEFTSIGSVDVLESIPHDTDASTQGLEVISPAKFGLARNSTSTETESYFLESTGGYGSSTIRLVELASGTVHHQLSLPPSYFGEGCTSYLHETTDGGGSRTVLRVVQITWQSGVGFVYETSLDDPPANLVQVGDFEIDTVSGQGWGICYLPHRKQFVVSDGTEFLHLWELQNGDVDEDGNEVFVFERVDTIPVTRRLPSEETWTVVGNLNELEWDPYSYNGETVLANVWFQDHVVRVRLSDGRVMHQYDLSSLERPSEADVLNGIAAALDSSTSGLVSTSTNQFWVTGKLWPQIYRVRLLDDGLKV